MSISWDYLTYDILFLGNNSIVPYSILKYTTVDSFGLIFYPLTFLSLSLSSCSPRPALSPAASCPESPGGAASAPLRPPRGNRRWAKGWGCRISASIKFVKGENMFAKLTSKSARGDWCRGTGSHRCGRTLSTLQLQCYGPIMDRTL